MQPNESAPEQAQDAQEQDPISMLGDVLNKFVDGVMSSSQPDEVKKQAQMVLQSFTDLAQMLSGGAAQGPQPMSGNEQMGGGNPNAQAVR